MLISKRKLNSLLEQARQEATEQEASKYMDKENFTRKYQALKDVYKMKHDRLYKDMQKRSMKDALIAVRNSNEIYHELKQRNNNQRDELARLNTEVAKLKEKLTREVTC